MSAAAVYACGTCSIPIATGCYCSDECAAADCHESLPWRVWCMNDCDWWLARSKREAIDAYEEECGEREDPADVHEVKEGLDTLKFTDGDERGRPVGPARTFREELARRVAAGITAPEMFATTEC
jgi:hypothetical protein